MFPVVLHHGFLGGGFGPLRWPPFNGIETALSEAGYPAIASRVHPIASIENRAKELKRWILDHRKHWDGRRIVLVAHSLGGLDARLMIAQMGMAQHVGALVTLSTPHRGTTVADWVVENLGRRLGGNNLLRHWGLDANAVADMTRESCRKFNREVPDARGTLYYSISAAQSWRKMPAFALPAWRLLSKAEGPNDGLVAVRSSAWGKNLGTWRTDHWRLVNRRVGLASRRAGDISPQYLELMGQIQPI